MYSGACCSTSHVDCVYLRVLSSNIDTRLLGPYLSDDDAILNHYTVESWECESTKMIISVM